MDSTTVATAVSEPATLPSLPEQKIFQMADGRFYNPSLGLSGATREEVMGITPTTSQTEVATPPATGGSSVVEDDVTSTIRSLYPESDSMVKQYDDMRKASGIETEEASLAQVNQELADLTAVIQNTEDEVRAQAGGAADESFIQATVADRIRRLQPRINQLSARQSALSANIQAKKDTIAERIGLTKFDIERSQSERENTRSRIFDLIEIYGSKAFEGMDPKEVADLERRAGLPPGSIAGRTTMKEREAEARAAEEPSVSEKYGSGVIGEYNFYAEQETAAGRTPVSFSAYQDMDANRRKSVSGSDVTEPGGDTSELDVLAAMYNRGESLGAIGATRKAQVVARAEELKAEEALVAEEEDQAQSLATMFTEAVNLGEGIGAAVRDARAAGIDEETIRKALELQLETEQQSSDSFWKRLFYKG